MKKSIWGLVLVCALALTFSAVPTYAAESGAQQFLTAVGVPNGKIIPVECTDQPGNVKTCGTTQVLQALINLTRVLVALSGTGALLMFTYGGLLWIISAGNADRVQQGKSAMTAAAVGIAIIFGSWIIINTIILVVTQGKVGGQATLFGQNFGQEPNVGAQKK